MSDDTLTVQLVDGSSRIVFIDAETTITKSSTGSAKDITKGSQVLLRGESTSDGSFSAEDVQVTD